MILRYAREFAKWHRFEVTQDNWQQAWAMAWLAAGALVVLLCLWAGVVMAFSIGG